MATTVHIPAALLKSVDRRARALGVSRNRLIVRALERPVTARESWTPEFLEKLQTVDRETRPSTSCSETQPAHGARNSCAEWTDAVSQAFGQIKAVLERRGTRIEDFDAAIAADAIAVQGTLVTANRDHMMRVPRLRVEDCARR
jgi:hypothetical protein